MSELAVSTIVYLSNFCAKFVAFHPHLRPQVTKAYDLVVSGGISPCAFFEEDVFALSSNGVTEYRVMPNQCECPAGERGVLCYHRFARRLWFIAQEREVITSKPAPRASAKPLTKALGNHCQKLHTQNAQAARALTLIEGGSGS